MDETNKVIEPKEKILWKGKPNFLAWISSTIIIAIIGLTILTFFVSYANYSIIPKVWFYIGLAFIFILIVVYTNLSYAVTQYVITDKRAIIQSGVIGRDFKSIDYDKVQNASVSVGPIGVIFKVGSVNMFTGEIEVVSTGQNSSSVGSKYDTFSCIEKPYDVLKILQERTSARKESLYGGKSK